MAAMVNEDKVKRVCLAWRRDRIKQEKLC